jgi:hypothetical protein
VAEVLGPSLVLLGRLADLSRAPVRMVKATSARPHSADAVEACIQRELTDDQRRRLRAAVFEAYAALAEEGLAQR